MWILKFTQMRYRETLTIIASLLLGTLTIVAQSRQTRQEYVARYCDIAVKHMEKYGIPASITMAQGILESDSGNSELSSQSNNHFGIKCKSNWTGRKVYYDDDAKGECFRAYKSVETSYEDHAIFLDSSPRYDSLFAYSSSDYKSWARGLKAAGYATAPHYADLLIKIIDEEQLYLLDRDNGLTLYAQRHDLPSEEVAPAQEDVADATTSNTQIDPDNYSVTINAHRGYNIERRNGLFCTRAKSGEKLEELAKAFEVSKWNLSRFNDFERHHTIAEGDIIYIERKKKSWEQNDKRSHKVKEGETLYTISQLYGIRLRHLAKLNSLKKSEAVTVDQIIIIQ